MTRFVIAVLLFLSLVPVANASEYCDRYKFGSPEWWTCRQGQQSFP